jgi:hypothetical protein
MTAGLKTFIICFANAILEFVQNSRESAVEGVEASLNRLDEIIKPIQSKR